LDFGVFGDAPHDDDEDVKSRVAEGYRGQKEKQQSVDRQGDKFYAGA